MDRLLKVATPLTALTTVVPPSVPPPGFVPMDIVIDAELPVTKFPVESSTWTVIAGVIDEPAGVVLGGWVTIANLLAKPVTVNVALLP
jgi:hypothetical protein